MRTRISRVFALGTVVAFGIGVLPSAARAAAPSPDLLTAPLEHVDELSPAEILDGLPSDELPSVEAASKTAVAPRLVITVHKSIYAASHGAQKQFLSVALDGKVIHNFPCSTAKERRVVSPSGRVYYARTPSGTFPVTHMDKNYYSRTWKVRMPFAVFFHGGVAIHATSPSHYAELGKPASGGCVRLGRTNAQTVYDLVTQVGASRTRIVVE
jgi:lipoprotein-anchoring transpeptidase ErfK/SrfK